jgi:hypothetical protein
MLWKNPTPALPEGDGVIAAIPSPKRREFPENSLPFGEGLWVGFSSKKADFQRSLSFTGARSCELMKEYILSIEGIFGRSLHTQE